MFQNIVFIGGIHGAGKGTVCSEVCSGFNLHHLSASEVLKWSQVSKDANNKLVSNIQNTQSRLIDGLKNTVKADERYILDGHFCLLDSMGIVRPIPVDVFSSIAPVLFAVVICDAELIAKRLIKRDSKVYDVDTLRDMQEQEVEYGKKLANILNKPFVEIPYDDITILSKTLKLIF